MLTPCHGKTNITCVTWLNWLFADGCTSVFSTLIPCHVKTTVTCVTWPNLAVCRWLYISIQYADSLSRKNYRNMCHMAQILDLIILLIHQSFETIQGLLNVDSLSREN